jgi:putative transposase
VKVVADTLGVARSNLVVRAARGRRSRLPYRKAGDPELLARIRALVDQRPTYGYRRITALLNREGALSGGANVNHKRVFRIMQRSGLLLERHSGRRPGRVHDGKVIVMRSNLRWCSDVFEIACWNGEIVRVAFVIDAHDREVIGWHGVAGAGIGGEAIRDLMLAAVESRFHTLVVPHAIEWLSDHGSPYTAKDTRDFACALGLQPCFTPIASPESNGLAEALVRTLKRDYVRVNPLPDALTVLRQLHRWFTDYNDNHPHSGLGMRSPREFIRAHSSTATCPV